MSEKRESFVFYRSFWEAVKELPEEYKTKVMDAICTYALDGEEMDMDPVVNAMFRLVRPQLDANIKRYENGKKGGRPKKKKEEANSSEKEVSCDLEEPERKEEKPKENQTETTPEPNVNVNDNVNVNGNVNVNANANVNAAGAAEELFERLWDRYPKQRGKAMVTATTKAELAKIGEEEMTRAIQRYVDGLSAESWRKPQDGSTFFTRGYVDYLDANYTQPKEVASKPKNSFCNFEQRDYTGFYDDLENRCIEKVNSGM